MDADEVQAELARLEQRAKKRMRTRLPFAVLVGCATVYAVNRWTSTRQEDHAHHAGSALRAVLVVGIAVIVVAVVAFVLWKTRKRWLPLSSWSHPPPAAGLNWRDRRTVYRDIRRATPNRDPVLRAVEHRSVEQLRRLYPRWVVWTTPALAVLLVALAVLPGRTESTRVFYAFAAVMFTLASAAVVRLRRGVARFPDQAE